MIDKAVLHVLATAKAYAALVGSLVTLYVATAKPAEVPSWLPTVLALVTAFATWAVPNAAAATTSAAPVVEGGQDA
jgi:hypothetical protein